MQGMFIKSCGNGIFSVKLNRLAGCSDLLTTIQEMGMLAEEAALGEEPESAYILMPFGSDMHVLEARNIDEQEIQSLKAATMNSSDAFKQRVMQSVQQHAALLNPGYQQGEPLRRIA
jgi:hypothetical protein